MKLRLLPPTSTSQLLVDAYNENTAVIGWVTAVNGVQWPEDVPEYDWWTSFTREWPDVQAHANVWNDTISSRLTSLPQGIVDLNGAWVSARDDALSRLGRLIAGSDPNEADDRAALANDLSLLVGIAGPQRDQAKQLVNDMSAYSAQLSLDLASLRQVFTAATNEQGADRDKIQALTDDITRVREDIDKYNQQITLSAIGLAVSIFVGLVGIVLTVATGPFGLIVIGVAVAGVGLSIAEWVIAQENIKADMAKIANDQGAIGPLNVEIATLGLLLNVVMTLINSANSASAAVDSLVTLWNQIWTDLSIAATDLSAAESDLTVEDYQDLQRALAGADAEWGLAEAIANDMIKIKYQVDGTPVRPAAA